VDGYVNDDWTTRIPRKFPGVSPMNNRAGNTTRAPVFCPRCRRGGDPEDRLCPRCGDELLRQGYCPICKGWVQAPPGSDCPKHEVETLDGVPDPGFDSSTTPLVTIASFGLPAEAHGPKLRLEAEGIPVFLDGARMGENVIYGVATGGVKLQVPQEFADDARVLLAQSWAAPKGEDPDDPWEGLAPDPVERRRSVMKVMILVFLFGPLVVSLLGFLISTLSR
jgi:hypothetical protein